MYRLLWYNFCSLPAFRQRLSRRFPEYRPGLSARLQDPVLRIPVRIILLNRCRINTAVIYIFKFPKQNCLFLLLTVFFFLCRKQPFFQYLQLPCPALFHERADFPAKIPYHPFPGFGHLFSYRFFYLLFQTRIKRLIDPVFQNLRQKSQILPIQVIFFFQICNLKKIRHILFLLTNPLRFRILFF